MLDLSPYINLPYALAAILAMAIFFYVLMDGFDLGIGILFPLAPSDSCRDKMIHSFAPFWDGNETWLILGGGGLFAAFPLAYSIILPALYIPIILMLLGLIFRGVAFEFHFKAKAEHRRFWDLAFHFGSLIATFFQGTILGAFISGIKVHGRQFAGGSFDWITPFSMMTGVALIFGYVLLGSTWLIMKTDGLTQSWARKAAMYVTFYVLVFIGIVSLWVPFLYEEIRQKWFSWPNLLYLSPIPFLTLIISIWLLSVLYRQKKEITPFILALFLFLLCYLGLGVSLWPWIVPYQIPLWEAAANSSTLTLDFIGIVLLLPFIISYTLYSYYIFKGKTSENVTY